MKKVIERLGIRGFLTGILLLTVILALILGIAVSSLSPGIMNIDFTRNGMYTLSDISKEAVSEVKEEVTLYLIASAGYENETIHTVLRRYESLSSNISVRFLYTETDGEVINGYTADRPENGSVIVESGKRSVYLPYHTFFHYSEEAEYRAMYLYNVYYQNGAVSCTFPEFVSIYGEELGLYDGYCYENAVTAAVKYVLSDAVKTVYLVSGHGEPSLTDDIKHRLIMNMTELKRLDLNSSGIPGDASAVMLAAENDITETEKEILSSYVAQGGKLMLLSGYGEEKPNIAEICAGFGLSCDGGYLCEDNENYCFENYPAMIMPDVGDEAAAEAMGDSGKVILSGCTGITVSPELPFGITVTPFLTTSPEAYTKTDTSKGLEFSEETDRRAQYYVGVKAENSAGGELIWLSTTVFMYDDYDVFGSDGNKAVMFSLLSDMTGSEENVSGIVPVAVINEVLETKPSVIYIFVGVAVIVLAVLAVICVRVKRR